MDGLKFPTVGAELRSGCIMVELSMRLPRGGWMYHVGGGRRVMCGLSVTTETAGTSRTQRGGRRKVENGLANDNKRDELTDDKRGRAHAEDFLAYNTRRRKEEE